MSFQRWTSSFSCRERQHPTRKHQTDKPIRQFRAPLCLETRAVAMKKRKRTKRVIIMMKRRTQIRKKMRKKCLRWSILLRLQMNRRVKPALKHRKNGKKQLLLLKQALRCQKKNRWISISNSRWRKKLYRQYLSKFLKLKRSKKKLRTCCMILLVFSTMNQLLPLHRSLLMRNPIIGMNF